MVIVYIILNEPIEIDGKLYKTGDEIRMEENIGTYLVSMGKAEWSDKMFFNPNKKPIKE